MPKTDIQTIFFDLDHTLWDYEVNSRETLSDLFHAHSLRSLLDCSIDEFLKIFREVNDVLWHRYNHHEIGRDTIRNERFNNIFEHFGVSDMPLSLRISKEYLEICPTKPHLFPHAHETLQYLQDKYPMHIITNGFNDVQEIKMRASGLDGYFDVIITSETAGHRKPSQAIFELACERANTSPRESLMIGDNLKADIEGAQSADLHAMYFNPERRPHSSRPDYEIYSLREVQDLL